MVNLKHYIKTPVGILQPRFMEGVLIGLHWLKVEELQGPICSASELTTFNIIQSQVLEYFAGQRTCFHVNINFAGTEFQNKVWNELISIPYGEIRTYQEIAERIGAPRAARAVGQANRRNPFPIIVPCHRVIGADGNLTGYNGSNEQGLKIKRYLLQLEQNHRL
jgi:methylated-DNA-[protein]-cysteine S-methyltransferase